ncbi:DEAD/DEAH box helicase [Candidatus Woesearchaeota archaeon]|nr:DEAD/DEAH box helicase [Candidatus Woesearchaeota archaeon]
MEEITSFKDLKLMPALERAITKQGYTIPTPIQAKSIPGLLLGKDLIGIAQTGTGKTAAFVLPILQRMTEKYPRTIKTLVLAPTRELAAQIGESFSVYGEFLKFKHTVIFGGISQGRQVQALSKGVDIVVATPGRLLDLMNQRKLNLNSIEFFVLDEADRMLDMGFIHDIKKVIAKLPHKRQSLFFSATMSPQINTLAKSLLKNPIHVEVTPQATTVELIKQYVFFTDQSSKEKLLLELLRQKHLTSVLIFTRTKHRANKVAVYLNKHNIPADAIHGNKSQNQRTKAISNFKTGKINVLVATDIAARGIDIKNISHVINFELPNEPESYVHRIGRTARAGTDGTAFSFCAAEERNFLRDIEKLIKQEIEVMDHTFHSETAKNAVGTAAKPPPRKSFGRGSRSKHKSASRKPFSRNGNSGNKFKNKRKRR